MPAPLPVGKIVAGAFLIPWHNRRSFVLALALPLALLVVFTAAWRQTFDALPESDRSWLAALYLPYAALFSLFAVVTHRLVLLNAASGLPQWTWRETRFLAWMITVWLIYTLTTFLVVFAGMNIAAKVPGIGVEWLHEWTEELTMAGKVASFYVFARLSPVFPATAVDARPTLGWAWRLTRANGWRLFLVVGMLPWVISYLVGFLYRAEPSPLEMFALSILATALFAVEIAALSVAYRELMKGAPEE